MTDEYVTFLPPKARAVGKFCPERARNIQAVLKPKVERKY